MKRASKKQREIRFHSGKCGRIICVNSYAEQEYAKRLEADDRVEKASVLYELGDVPAREEDGICHLVASRDETAWEELPVELDAGRLRKRKTRS